MNNIYILTEEKPKISTLLSLLDIYKNDFGGDYNIESKLKIMPLIENGYFGFIYEFLGVDTKPIKRTH